MMGNKTTMRRGENEMTRTTESTTHLQPHEQLLVGWIVGGTTMLEGEQELVVTAMSPPPR
jgi:hypothetical protein